MSRQIVILGVHRSGSSCVAGVLQRLGVSTGYRVLPADQFNAAGYYEDLDFLHVNDYLVEKWYDPQTQYRRGAQRLYAPLVRHRDADFQVWAIKDPRMCITLPLFAELLSDPYFVICRRPLEESVNSMNNAYFKGERHDLAARIQKLYAGHLQTRVSEYPQVPKYEVRFRQLLADPDGLISELSEFVFTGLDSPAAECLRSAIEFVSPQRAGHSRNT